MQPPGVEDRAVDTTRSRGLQSGVGGRSGRGLSHWTVSSQGLDLAWEVREGDWSSRGRAAGPGKGTAPAEAGGPENVVGRPTRAHSKDWTRSDCFMPHPPPRLLWTLIPIKKPVRHREAKSLAQGHTADKLGDSGLKTATVIAVLSHCPLAPGLPVAKPFELAPFVV